MSYFQIILFIKIAYDSQPFRKRYEYYTMTKYENLLHTITCVLRM